MTIDPRKLVGTIERVGNPILNAITVPILESRWSWLLGRFIVTIKLHRSTVGEILQHTSAVLQAR